MPIRVECSACRAVFNVREKYAGKRGKCPRCQATFEVPAASAPAIAAPESETYDLEGAVKARAVAVPLTGSNGVASKRVAKAVAPTRATQTPARILAAFRGEIDPVRPTLLYRLWIVIVAGMMLLLPVLYVAFIGLVGAAVVWHASHNIAIFQHVHSKVALLLYVGPLIAGAVTVAFLLKPLFARPAKPPPTKALDPSVEPLVFAFVDGVCTSVGAPRPSRIEVDCNVNASAHRASGPLAIFSNDLVLTIGLPLAAGLTLKQFAGVLAHEFGHFSQGAGMRVSGLIRTINFWFARVVYERDQWDETLAAWSAGDNSYDRRRIAPLVLRREDPMSRRLRSWHRRGLSFGMVALASAAVASAAVAGDAAVAVRHVVVYAEQGRFAGWPANHGIWSWGNEILVGFSRGYYKDRGPYHHIDHDKPEEYVLARSRDGGLTWTVEEPKPKGALTGTPGMRHGTMPPGAVEERPTDLAEPIQFTHPDFALTVRMQATNDGASRYYYSYDRGNAWRGPYRLPLFDQKGVMGRTDYLVSGPNECLLFLTASKANRREGRPFCARTSDGGQSWHFVSFIGPEPTGYAIMPSTVRLAPTDLVTTIRRQDPPKSWIDAYASRDEGRSWSFLSRPEPDTGEGNPPSLLRLPDARLCLIYGLRAPPFGIYARMSSDRGRTWSDRIVLRDDGGGRDIGYVRSVLRPDGRVVAVYYYQDRSGPGRYLAATIWEP